MWPGEVFVSAVAIEIFKTTQPKAVKIFLESHAVSPRLSQYQSAVEFARMLLTELRELYSLRSYLISDLIGQALLSDHSPLPSLNCTSGERCMLTTCQLPSTRV